MPKFKFTIVRAFKDCLPRQLTEVIKIGRRKEVFNSKTEYNRCKIARLTIENSENEGNKKEQETKEDEKTASSPDEELQPTVEVKKQIQKMGKCRGEERNV